MKTKLQTTEITLRFWKKANKDFFFATTHFGYYLPTAEQYSKLQKKRARNSVPKCPCKLLQPADRPMAGSSSLEGHFGTGLRARFSSAWSNVGCGWIHPLAQNPNFLEDLNCQKTTSKVYKNFLIMGGVSTPNAHLKVKRLPILSYAMHFSAIKDKRFS